MKIILPDRLYQLYQGDQLLVGKQQGTNKVPESLSLVLLAIVRIS